ncbi:MAG: ParB/RepB/Spo0J family partition protein [Myxococcota bacterium]
MTPRPGRGLGRGLASLIPDSALEIDALPADREALRIVPIDEIRPNPEQPRELFDKDALGELAASITAYGILSPLIVRRSEGRYIVIAGERRLRAAALAGLKEVPVVVREADAPSRQLELALVENLQRADLDPIESARGFQRLIDEYGYTQDQVASSVGKDRSTVANAVRLLKLPEFVLGAMRDGKLSAGHARAMLPVTDEDDLRAILSKVVTQGLNVRQTERLVNEHVRTPPVLAAEKHRKEKALDYAVKLLQEALHTNVAIQTKPTGGGKIVVDYADAEDLERLIGLLRRTEK